MNNPKHVTLSSILTWLKEHIKPNRQEGLSIINQDCLIEGTLNIKGKLIVAGSLKGTLIADTVVMVKGSHVNTQAKVREMVIGGECQGDIAVYENLKILSTGVFSGKMTCKNITLEAGGKLNGKVKLLGSGKEASRTETALAAKRVSPAPPEVKSEKKEAVPSKRDENLVS